MRRLRRDPKSSADGFGKHVLDFTALEVTVLNSRCSTKTGVELLHVTRSDLVFGLGFGLVWLGVWAPLPSSSHAEGVITVKLHARGEQSCDVSLGTVHDTWGGPPILVLPLSARHRGPLPVVAAAAIDLPHWTNPERCMHEALHLRLDAEGRSAGACLLHDTNMQGLM